MVFGAPLLAHLLDLMSTCSMCKPKSLFKSFINQTMMTVAEEMGWWWMSAEKKLEGWPQFAVFRAVC